MIGGLGLPETKENDTPNTPRNDDGFNSYIGSPNQSTESIAIKYPSGNEQEHPKSNLNIIKPSLTETTITMLFTENVENANAKVELDSLQYEFLSTYIATHNSSLNKDPEGVVDFFMNKFKLYENEMTFPSWLNFAIDNSNEEYIKSAHEKLGLLDRGFSRLRDIIANLDLQKVDDLSTLKLILDSLEEQGFH